jgi:hypothetical protein
MANFDLRSSSVQYCRAASATCGETMNWKSKAFLSATGIFLIAFPVSAQRVGSYTGKSADGNVVNLTIAGSPGAYTISGLSVGFTAQCKTGTADEGWGFSVNTPIVIGGNTTFVGKNDEVYINGTLHFTTNKKIEGSITSRTAVFIPGPTPPTAAHFCQSSKQSFTSNFESASVPLSIGPGNDVVHRIEPETPPY